MQPDAFKYIEKQPIGPRPTTKTRRESDTSNLQQKPAKILRTPMSTSVVEGATAQFTCQVEGNPKPKVRPTPPFILSYIFFFQGCLVKR